jgi:nitrate reductase NapE component
MKLLKWLDDDNHLVLVIMFAITIYVFLGELGYLNWMFEK